MQLTRRLRSTAFTLGLCATWAAAANAASSFEDPTVGSLFRFFSDSDHIAVRSMVGDGSLGLLGGALALHWNNERVSIPAIEAPAGSQEAIDAITTASRPIAGNAFEDFVKIRNEIQGALSRGPAAVDYYVSSESDYLAQQLGARYNRDFSSQLNLAFGASYGWDAIAPLADDDTNTADDTRTTMHWNAVATQVVSPTFLVRFGLEYNIVEGLQHNPYRNVYAGGINVPERHPDQRARRDAFIKLNQYLSNRSSLKFSYRFYNDDWGIDSHELGPTLSQYITQGAFMRYQYRYYTQSSADFYRDEYATIDGIDGFRSGDYRMASLSSHLFGVEFDLDLDALAAVHRVLRPLGLRFSYERYFNSNNYSANIVETGIDYHF